MDSLLQSERHSGPSHVDEHSIYSSWHFDEHFSSKGRSLKGQTKSHERENDKKTYGHDGSTLNEAGEALTNAKAK